MKEYIVLQNIPSGYSDQLVKDYVEANLDIDVDTVSVISDLAWVMLKRKIKDHQEAQRVVSTEPIESHQIRLHFSQVVTTAIVVSNTDKEKASQEQIKKFLENKFNVEVLKIQIWRDKKIAFVHFEEGSEKESKFKMDSGTKVTLKANQKDQDESSESSSEDTDETDTSSDDASENYSSNEKKSVKKKESKPALQNSDDESDSDDEQVNSFKLRKSENLSQKEKIKRKVESSDDSDDEDKHLDLNGRKLRKSENLSQKEKIKRKVESSDDSGDENKHLDLNGRKLRKSENLSHNKKIKTIESSDDSEDEDKHLEEDDTESDDSKFSDRDSSTESETDEKQACEPLPVHKAKRSYNHYDSSRQSQDPDNKKIRNLKKENMTLKLKINELENTVQCLSNKIKELEDSKPYKKTQEMKKHEYEQLVDFFGVIDGVCVSYNKEKKLATLKGKENEVNFHLCKMLTKLTQLEIEKLEISPTMFSILSTEKGEKFLKDFMDSNSQGKRVTFTIDDKCIYLAATDDTSLNSVKDKLQRKLNYKDITLSNTPVSEGNLYLLKHNLEKNWLLCLSWKEDLKEIYTEGIEDDVIYSQRDINELIGSHLIHEKVYTVNDLRAQFIQKHLQPKVTSIVSKVECETKDYKTYTFKGDNNSVRIVYGAFRDIVENIVTQTWDLRKVYLNSDMDLWLLFNGLNEDMVKEKIDQIEIKEKCLIRINLPVTNTFTRNVDSAKAKANSTSTKAIKKSGQVNIKIGNIVEESSDILVCVLDNHIKLSRTGIGKAFLKACPALKDKLETTKQQNPKSTVITTMGPFAAGLTCKAVCSIVVTRWDKSHSKHELKEWVNTIMKKAMEIGAKSISFPPIGCGKAFKFPITKLSKTMLETVNTFLTSNPGALKVNIVAEKKDDFDVLNQTAELYAKPSTDVVENNVDNTNDEEENKVQLVRRVKFELSITAEKETDKNVIFTKLSEYFNNQCLHTAEVKDNTLPVWPSTLQKRIEEKAENSSVHVSFSSDENEIKCCLKGFKQNVEVLEKFAMNEIHEVVKNFPRKSIKASNTPARGTVEFIKYASKINETCPTYWKVYSDKRYWKNVVDRNEERPASGQSKTFLISVDDKTKKAVIDLVQKTWEPALVGAGADARGLVPNTTIEVLDVQRVENIHLFDRYANERKMLFQKMVENDKPCDDFGITLPSKQLKTTEFLESFMKEELYSEINEHYLFHGTKSNLIVPLTKQGLDPKLCTNGMLGKGVYLAEKSTKSDQYTDPKPKEADQKRSAPGTKLYLFLLRSLLGNTYVVQRDHPKVGGKEARFVRPPCLNCKDDKCSKGHESYDSITLDGGNSPNSLYREFVVYSDRCCYPEYLITYKRVPPK
ncbi:uncharacterized protein LOC131934838 isoform X2 [Physella acuta]|uniref:uncharacterized protein LOC131934838 isoform X2 n=1 Tax=Physella acuta TaxID=109671 RepID=UPI0027DDF119|nr:uncharacterized protein LOC131934838 isoform X2 [Physella acuta]